MKIRFNLITAAFVVGFLSSYASAAVDGNCSSYNYQSISGQDSKRLVLLDGGLVVPVNITKVADYAVRDGYTYNYAMFMESLPKVDDKDWQKARVSQNNGKTNDEGVVIPEGAQLDCICASNSKYNQLDGIYWFTGTGSHVLFNCKNKDQ